MANILSTAIGRVVPFFRGTWQPNQGYDKLDNVLYEPDGSTYIAKITVPSSVGTPPENPSYWQLLAKKGNTGGVGTVMATATSAAEAYASATVDGDDPSAMNFTFNFGLPKGDTGDPAAITSVSASATQLGPLDPPTASVEMGGSPTAATLSFTFGIPAVEGGVSQVDGYNPTAGNVILSAVQYGRVQSLDNSQKIQALTNIGAQPAGDYMVNPSASAGQFLQYDGTTWAGSTIETVPAGTTTDVGKYLCRGQGSLLWSEVQTLPQGGDNGAPLIKNSISDYDVTWGSFITVTDIDTIVAS